MSGRNKLKKFADLLRYPNVYENMTVKVAALVGENGTIVDMKGKWHKEHFKNENPITLELACGRGEYSVGLGRLYPERNFIGVDIKGARIWQGASIALEEGLHNVAFLRTRIEQIVNFFAKDEINEIWLTFPDPFLRNSKANKRLTSPPFLREYRKILKSNGLVHLKTDSPQLYEFTVETVQAEKKVHLEYKTNDLYANALPLSELGIKTYYENLHISGDDTIKYVCFRLEQV